MIIITSNSGHTAYGLKSYVIDKKVDLQNLQDTKLLFQVLRFLLNCFPY